MDSCISAKAAFERLNTSLGLAPLPSPAFDGDEAVAPTPLRVAAGSAVSLASFAASCAEIWRLRGGEAQRVAIAYPAAAALLCPLAHLRLNGRTVNRPFKDHPLTGFYQCADGRWVFLHGGFAGTSRLLDLINAPNERQAIVEGVAKWNSRALEDAIAYLNVNGALARSAGEWSLEAQARALAAVPPIRLEKVGDAPPLRLPQGSMPLAGLKVLDVGCGLSGPLAAQALAAFGAEVLAVRSPYQTPPDGYALVGDAGKRAIALDLSKPASAESLRRAARQADIFIESYRPGALKRFGFTPAALMHNAPGMIHVAVSAFGPVGPWAHRRGFEPEVQAATGLAAEQGVYLDARRRVREALPVLIDADVCAVLAGQLAAAGAAAAALRRIREGGSWSVSVSLAGAAMWLQALGRLDAGALPDEWAEDGLDSAIRTCETDDGVASILGPVVRMDKTPPLWSAPKPAQPEEEARFTTAREDVHAA